MSNSFLPPDYSEAHENEFPQIPSPEEEDDDLVEEDDLGIDEEELEELDSASVNDKDDYEINPVQQQKQANERIIMSTPQSSPPFGSVGFGSPSPAPSTSPWQSSGASLWGNQGGSSFQRPAQSPWGSNSQPSTSPWGNASGIGGQKVQINRSKKVIFCDFIDGAVEAYGANGKPGLRPRDIYDLHPRFEVWDKLAAFNPERIYFTIPASLIPESANGINAWNVTLSYFCCSISSYLRLPFDSCQILKQNHVGQSKDSVFKAILDRGISPEDAVVIGIYSGGAGLSDVDQVAANNCGIDYIDLNTLLTSMF